MKLVFNKHLKYKKQNCSHLVFSLAIVVSILTAPLVGLWVPTGSANAKKYDQMTPRERALSYAYAETLRACLDKGSYRDGAFNDRIKDSSAKSYRFFTKANPGNDTLPGSDRRILGAGYLLDYMQIPGLDGKGSVACGVDDGVTPWLKNALDLWGYSSPLDFLCGSNAIEGIGASRTDGDDCRNGNKDFTPFNKENVMRVISNVAYGGKNIEMGSAGEYLYNLAVFTKGCQARPSSGTVDSGNERLFKGVKVVNSDGSIEEIGFYGQKKKSDEISYKRGQKITCQGLVDRINGGSGATDYAKWLALNPDSTDTRGADQQTGEGERSCNIDGVGWLICPSMLFMGNLLDGAYNFISDTFLAVEKDIVDSDKLKNAWGAFQGLANALFIVAFIAIVYSQLTGAGISNYGVKRMLPRLIVVAILVNLSFIICQLAVDISNILGKSASGFLSSGIASSTPDLATITANQVSPVQAAGVVTLALALGGLALYLLLPVLGATLLAGLASVLIVVFMLLARKALVILLIAISPLAFAAYLLPNTEKLFQKWRSMFVGLLLIFPIVGLLFGASSLAAEIIQAGRSDLLWQTMALAVSTVPLFATIPLLRSSLNATGKIGATIGSLGERFQKLSSERGASSRLGQLGKYTQEKRARTRSLTQAGAYTGINPIRKGLSAVNRKYNESSWSGRFGSKSAAAGISMIRQEESKEVDEAVALINSGVDPIDELDNAAKVLKEANSSGDVVRARAAQKILLNGGAKGISNLHQAIHAMETTSGVDSRVSSALRSDINSAGIKGKDSALASWAYTNQTIADREVARDTFSTLSPVELAGQSVEALTQGSYGGISVDQARATLDNESAAGLLTDDKRQILQTIAGGAPTPSAAPTGGAPTGSPTPAAGSGGAAPAGSTQGDSGESGRVSVVDRSGETTETTKTPPSPPQSP